MIKQITPHTFLIECDDCGCGAIGELEQVIKDLKQDGWKIGNMQKCYECADAWGEYEC